MNRSRSKIIIFFMLLFMSISLFGCGSGSNGDEESERIDIKVVEESLYGHALTGSLELEYAKEYSVSFYEGGLTLITVGEDRFLLLNDELQDGDKEDASTQINDEVNNDDPNNDKSNDEPVSVSHDSGSVNNTGLPEEAVRDEKDGKLVILRKPLKNIYVASSSVLDFFDVLDALDMVTMTSTKAEDWSIDKIKKLVEEDEISYVGKYSMPDYEYILDDECSLAIENQMIYHSPETKEKLEALGIPVLVERSSLEENLLGRMEWIKLYGVLTGRLDEAEEVFEDQQEMLKGIEDSVRTDQDKQENSNSEIKAVLFYINASGIPSVRNPGDYMVDLIKIAGAEYTFDELAGDSTKTYINMQMEEFYAQGADTDVMIYNSNFGAAPETTDDLVKQDAILADFKAVKNKNVWCYSQDSYQQPTKLPEMALEMYKIFKFVRCGGDEPELVYFYRLK